MLDSIIFYSTLAPCDSLRSLLCRCTLFLSRTPTFVNWALAANKLRVMCCVFIKNMLEEHRPIKDSVFYKEWWDEQWILGELAQWGSNLNPIVLLNLITIFCLGFNGLRLWIGTFFFWNLKYFSLLLVNKKLKILFGTWVSDWKTFPVTYANHIIPQKILISSILTVIHQAM